MFSILKKLHSFYNYLLFLSERIKIQKVETLAANLVDKKEYVTPITKLKKPLFQISVLKKSA